MKYTHICPQCSHTEISRIEGGTFKGNFYNTISFGIHTVYLTRYVCTQCGFTENYVENKADLEKIHRKFGTLPPYGDGFV